MAHDDGVPTEDADPTENESTGDGLEGEPQLEGDYEEFVDGAPDDPEPLLPAREPLRRIFVAIGLVEQIVGGVLLFMILVLVLAQVVQRYVPGAWPWTGELARYSLVWATFLMAGYLVAYHPHHIAIHVVDYVAKGRTFAAVKFCVNLTILVTSGILLIGTYNLIATDIGQVSAAGEIPLRYINMVPFAGLVLVILRAVLGILVRDIPALRGRIEEAA